MIHRNCTHSCSRPNQSCHYHLSKSSSLFPSFRPWFDKVDFPVLCFCSCALAPIIVTATSQSTSKLVDGENVFGWHVVWGMFVLELRTNPQFSVWRWRMQSLKEDGACSQPREIKSSTHNTDKAFCNTCWTGIWWLFASDWAARQQPCGRGAGLRIIKMVKYFFLFHGC